jgi:hypothetical protein
MFRCSRYIALVATVAAFSGAAAQTPAADPSVRLREVLPPDVAERVLARIAEARARELPAAALENRALKFAARGVLPVEIERSVNEHAVRLQQAKDAIEEGRGLASANDETEAGAEAIRKGVDGAQVIALAKGAPSGRSLAVPLFVIGSLIDLGLSSDAALDQVQEKLQARASDRELEGLPGSNRSAGKPAVTGRDLAATKRPADAGKPTGAPASVPRNAGKGAAPGRGKKP